MREKSERNTEKDEKWKNEETQRDIMKDEEWNDTRE